MLPAAVATHITEQSAALERQTGHQFVVVTVRSLGGHKIEDYGVTLGRYWGIGRKNINDGVLLIVAPNERKVRIEVGKGLEMTLKDEEAARILANDVLPAFRRGDMPGGIQAGVNDIIGEIAAPVSKAA